MQIIAIPTPESSQVDSIGYDSETKTLQIDFKTAGGKVSRYHYSDVEDADWQALRLSPSKGRHVRQEIKGKFQYTKIS